MKIKFRLECDMEKVGIHTGIGTVRPTTFISRIETNLESTDINGLYGVMADRVSENMTTFQRQGNDWRLKSIIAFQIHTVDYEPLRGNSFIPLPKQLASKQAIINMKNNYDTCFLWCI